MVFARFIPGNASANGNGSIVEGGHQRDLIGLRSSPEGQAALYPVSYTFVNKQLPSNAPAHIAVATGVTQSQQNLVQIFQIV